MILKLKYRFHDATSWQEALPLPDVLQLLIPAPSGIIPGDVKTPLFPFIFLQRTSFTMKGLIFSVKRYSVHDGPGIRVTFFMKGCPLSCWWCHNPEGISPFQETVVGTRRVGEKEFRFDEPVGRLYSVEEIIEIAGRDSIFFHQSGGVTFSGGEPLVQFEFLLEALKKCKANGYNTVVDTSGYSSAENYKAIIRYTDYFLFDIKHLDNEKHIKYTGVPNHGILKNFKLVA